MATKMAPTRYKKTGGAANGLGESYECKMLTLIFLRMLSTGHEFQLASDMAAAGFFDDIVLRHRKDPDHEWDVSYMQLQHKQNKSKIIRKAELLGITGSFSLVSYCASYETMKSARELLSFGNFAEHKIVIFTNASLNDRLVDVVESDLLLSTGGSVVSFKAGGEVYRELCELVDFKAALTELHGQVDGKSGEEMGVIIKGALEGIKYNNKAVISWSDELLKSPTLMKLKDLLKKLARVSDKATYSSFLAKLQLYTNQAHESQFNAMIKEQLANTWICGDNLEADAMLHALRSGVKSWWQKDNVYLTEDSPLWLDIVKTHTDRLSKSTIDELTKDGVVFKESSLRSLYDAIPNHGIVNVRVDSRTTSRSLRVHQALAKFGADIVLHVNVEALTSREDAVLSAWASRWCRVLVVECDAALTQEQAKRIGARINEVVGMDPRKKLFVLISPEKHALNLELGSEGNYSHVDDEWRVRVWGPDSHW